MKNPPGLIHISTGGSANTTTIDIDGVMPMVNRATIIIDPKNGPNQIKLHCFSQQNNKIVPGKVESYYGVSKENYEFFKGLMERISDVPDSDLIDQWPSNGIPPRVMDVLDFINTSRRQGEST